MALPENPGFAISGGVHTALLALALISFSQTAPLGDAQESFPVAVLSGEQFNQIMKGEKTAAEVKPLQRTEKIAQTAELTSKASSADAPKDVPAPPSPLKPQPELGQAETREPPKPPPQSTAAPPSRPAQETVIPVDSQPAK